MYVCVNFSVVTVWIRWSFLAEFRCLSKAC